MPTGRSTIIPFRARLYVMAQEARDRAEEIRTIIETWKDPGAKEIMTSLAQSYDDLAGRLVTIADNGDV